MCTLEGEADVRLEVNENKDVTFLFKIKRAHPQGTEVAPDPVVNCVYCCFLLQVSKHSVFKACVPEPMFYLSRGKKNLKKFLGHVHGFFRIQHHFSYSPFQLVYFSKVSLYTHVTCICMSFVCNFHFGGSSKHQPTDSRASRRCGPPGRRTIQCVLCGCQSWAHRGWKETLQGRVESVPGPAEVCIPVGKTQTREQYLRLRGD